MSNPGGPGAPGLAYPLDLKPLLGEVASQYDLIGVDARFMGRSDPLDCGPVRLADLYRSSTTRRDFITGSRHAAGLGAEAAFDEWAAWAAWRDDKYHLGRTGMQVRANVTELVYRRTPVKVGKYRIDSAAMPWVLQSALGDESDRDLMARNVRTLLDAAAGKPIKPSEELLGFLGQFFEISPDLSRFAAASLSYTCNDNGWPSGPAQYWRDAQRDHKTQPLFAVTILPCAYWTDHTTEPDLVIGNNTPMLIVQADRDSIPVAWARKLHQKLPNSILKTVDRRAHGVYDERIPEMVAEVNRYLRH